jgi:predicted nucleic acid-binding protein
MAGKAEGYTCEINISELCYKTCEKLGKEAAEVRNASIRHSKITILPLDERLTHAAGGLKCMYRGKLPQQTPISWQPQKYWEEH